MKQVKQVKNLPYGENFYFTIINYIKLYGKLPMLPISKQARNYYIRQLKIDDIIYKLGYGTWSVNEDKANQYKTIEQVKKMPKASQICLDKVFTSSKQIRGHGFIVSFNIPKIPGWLSRAKFLNKRDIDFINVGINKSGQRIIHLGHKVHLYKSKIIIYSPATASYFAKSSQSAYKNAIYDLLNVFKSLENLFSVCLKVQGVYKFDLSRQHYGKIQDEIAKEFKRTGKRLIVPDKNGSTWLIADNSLNLSELETVHKETAVKDMDKVILPFFNSLKKHYDETGESLTVQSLLNLFVGVAKSSQTTNRNIELLTEQLKIFINR
jgi:hypothetical protein